MAERIVQKIVDRYNRINNLPDVDVASVPRQFQTAMFKTELDDFLTGPSNPMEFFADFVYEAYTDTCDVFTFQNAQVGSLVKTGDLNALHDNPEKYPYFAMWLSMTTALEPYRGERMNRKYRKIMLSGPQIGRTFVPDITGSSNRKIVFKSFNSDEFWRVEGKMGHYQRTPLENQCQRAARLHTDAYPAMYKLLATGPVLAALPNQGSITAAKNWNRAFNVFTKLEKQFQSIKNSH